MNEFSAKKLGEVLAFAQVGAATLDRARTALVAVWGTEAHEALAKELARQAEAISALAQATGVTAIVEAKAVKTGDKLTAMQEMYIGDEWDNAAEVCEWLGFFEGAALVHWSLVTGVAEHHGHAQLIEGAQSAMEAHRQALQLVADTLKKIGSQRASQ